MNIKEDLLSYINDHMNDTDEPYRMIDIFYNTTPTNGRLTFLGYKILSKAYTFYEVEIEFTSSVSQYSALIRTIKGMYYESRTKSKNHIRINTTDKKFINRLKLTKNDFSAIERSIKNSKKS